MKIKQKHYGTIDVDSYEQDIVKIWQYGKKGDINVVQVEKENIDKLIEILQKAKTEEV